MSDFLFSSQSQIPRKLRKALASIYLVDPVEGLEFHGDWGSLAVTKSLYNGFEPLETEQHICVVIGGPVFYFQNNHCLTGDDTQAGTRAILQRWLDQSMVWSEDLSGPFVALLIDKQTKSIRWVTDLMMFIPVYECKAGEHFAVGTHVDALAHMCGQSGVFDQASIADFILHDVVTYPYTTYTNIRQCHPAAVHQYGTDKNLRSRDSLPPVPYWLPDEQPLFRSLSEAAKVLRGGVTGYVKRVTESMDHVAQFISAGEDSRVLSGLLPERMRRDAYVFLDCMNREGRIAQKVAKCYSARFTPDFREASHYLNILQEASALVGSGQQYIHAHALGFSRRLNLGAYFAVFGGYLSDVLLKGYLVKLDGVRFRLPLLYQKQQSKISALKHYNELEKQYFLPSVIDTIAHRRAEHWARIQVLRPLSCSEWFNLWPITMRPTASFLSSNRRLFPNYEPFMAKEAVKVSAATPIHWKLNRRLFNKAFRPYLLKSMHLRHADGRFPYFPWWLNCPISCITLLFRKITRKINGNGKNEGPWANWNEVVKTKEWKVAKEQACISAKDSPLLMCAINRGAFSGNELNNAQKINLLQSCNMVAHNGRDTSL